MASETEICNSGLQRIGVKRISIITEDSKNGRACNFAYPLVRRRLMRKYAWNFCKKRVTLAPDATAPDHKFLYQFSWPTDCIRILPDQNVTDWAIEGKKIRTNDGDTLEVLYLAEIIDPNEFDAIFHEVISIAVAHEVVMELKGSKSLKKELAADMREVMADARRINAYENIAVEPPVDDWIAARY